MAMIISRLIIIGSNSTPRVLNETDSIGQKKPKKFKSRQLIVINVAIPTQEKEIQIIIGF